MASETDSAMSVDQEGGAGVGAPLGGPTVHSHGTQSSSSGSTSRANDTPVDDTPDASRAPPGDESFSSDANRDERDQDRPGFKSPPESMVSKDSLQTSLLGHSAREQVGEGEDGEEEEDGDSEQTNGKGANGHHGSDSQSHDASIDKKKAYAVQSQQSEDKKQSQEQSVENIDEHETHVKQRQSQERADGSDAEQENDVTITQESDGEGHDHLNVETSQRNKGGQNADGTVKQVNHVKVVKRGDDCASCTSSGGTLDRPSLRKKLLHLIEFGDDLGEAVRTPSRENEHEYERHLSAPSVFMSFEDEPYVLFRTWDGEPEDGFGLDTRLLFDDIDQHALYYEQIESLFEALHDQFDSLDKTDEIILRLPDLGLDLHEDSVYTREVALYDLDRIHVGCGLSGRLRLSITSGPRFSTNFNLLTDHIAKSYETGKIDSAHAAPPARYPEVVDETSSAKEEDRPDKKRSDRDQSGTAGANQNHDDRNGDDDEMEHDGGDGQLDVEQVLDDIERDDPDDELAADDAEAPLDELQVPDVDLEAERVEGMEDAGNEVGTGDASYEVELGAVAGEEEGEDYIATQAVDDETAEGDGTEYADVVEGDLEGEHAEQVLVEAGSEAKADDVPSEEGKPPAVTVPSDSATLPAPAAPSTADFEYSAQDDTVEAVLGDKPDPSSYELVIDYSVDEAEAVEASVPATATKVGTNVRDSTAAELDDTDSATKRRRTSSPDDAKA